MCAGVGACGDWREGGSIFVVACERLCPWGKPPVGVPYSFGEDCVLSLFQVYGLTALVEAATERTASPLIAPPSSSPYAPSAAVGESVTRRKGDASAAGAAPLRSDGGLFWPPQGVLGWGCGGRGACPRLRWPNLLGPSPIRLGQSGLAGLA